MLLGRRAVAAFVAGVGMASATLVAQGDVSKTENPRPRLQLRARPEVGITPARVVFTAELIGGANDFEEYYCPTVEWDWGDDTRSESTLDCQPYEAGKSEIRRRFTIERTFKLSGVYKVFIRLKRRDREVAAATTTVTMRPGARDFGE
jgi:hypothetical protein